MSPRDSTPPVGFCGEFRMMSLVLVVISARHLVHIHGEVALFAQRNRHRRAA